MGIGIDGDDVVAGLEHIGARALVVEGIFRSTLSWNLGLLLPGRGRKFHTSRALHPTALYNNSR